MRASTVVLILVGFGVVGCDCSAGRDRDRPRDGGTAGFDVASFCTPPQIECAGVCITATWDRENCGACGNVCPAGEVCSEGACGTTCGGLRPTRCGDECIDISTHPSHCGGCDMPCADGLFCMDGTCTLSCGEFAMLCGDVCTDFRTDPLNCGSCGNECPTLPHSTPTCADGVCGFVCDAGWADCNTLPEDGCETSLLDDVHNCGSCGNDCPVPDHAVATCEGGVCGFECLPDYELVDGMCEGGSDMCYTGVARVLVYGPGLRTGVDLIPAGEVTVTVATEAMWRTMTTADFGNYDIVWIDGASCSSDAATVYGTLQDTISTWGPAITGRAVLMIGDPDYHAESWSTIWYTNNARWLKQNGRNADGGHTSLFWNWGCAIFTSNTMGLVPGRGTPEMFTSVLGSPLTTDTTNYCFGITAATGVGHPVTAGMTSYWSCAMHGGFLTYPPGYTVLANGDTRMTGNCAIARDPFPCTP